MSEKKKMTLIVQSQHPIFTGKRGTLFAVGAMNAEDNMQLADLRTWHPALPLNVPTEFEMESYDHAEYGRTWTIKYDGAGLADRVVALEKQNAEFDRRLKELEGRLGGPEQGVHPAQREHGDGLPQGPRFG